MKDDICTEAVIDWNARPKRKRNPPPPTYWEEYVATDAWYTKELVADIPEEEWEAAVNDDNWDEGDGESGDDSASDVSTDADYSESVVDDDDGGDSSSTGEDSDGSVSDAASSDGADTVDDPNERAYTPRTPPGSPGSEEGSDGEGE